MKWRDAVSRSSWAGRTTLLVALGVASCGGSQEVSPEDIASGQQLFRTACASCHGQNAGGLPKLGKDLHRNGFVSSLDDRQLLEFFKQGRPADHPLNELGVDMPPKGGNPALQDEDLRLIVAYVRSIQ